MKIYWQWENERVYRGIALVCVYTISMASSAYLCVYTTYLRVYTTYLRVYTTSTSLQPHMSTLYPHVYSTSICLLYIHMSTLYPHVYTTCTCLLYIYMSTLHLHVYSTSTCLLYIYMSILYPHVSTRPRLLFTSLSTLPPPIASPAPSAAAGEPVWDPGVFTIIIIFFPYWWLSDNFSFSLSNWTDTKRLQGFGETDVSRRSTYMC